MFEKILAFLDKRGWQYHLMNNKKIAIFTINGSFGVFRCFADAEKDGVFSFYSICSINTPQKSLQRMSEFLTRINYNRTIGNFEMDYSDGEIRYKTSTFYKETMEEDILERLIMLNIISMDTALDALVSIMYTDTPIQSILEGMNNVFITGQNENNPS